MSNAHRLLPAAILGMCVAVAISDAQAVCLLEAYRDAATSDPQLKGAAATRSAQLEAKPQARALLLPNLGAGGTVDRVYSDRSIGNKNYNSSNVNIGLNQPIYNRGFRVQQQLADASIDQAEADFATAEQDLLVRVTQRYFNVLSAEADLTFVKADKNATARQLEQATQRFEVGLITITDVLEAQARLDAALTEEILAINNVADSKEALREVTGKYYEKAQPFKTRIPLLPPNPKGTDAWLDMALENNTLLQSAMAAVAFADRNVDLQKSGHYPTLDLNASFSSTNDDIIDASGGRIGLQLEIPLYQGGAVTSRTREAAFQHEAAKESREQIQRSIRRQIRDAYRGVEEAISQVKALDQTRKSTRSALEATQAGFEVGTRTIVDVLDAQRDVFSAERNYVQARHAYALNRVSLKQAAGILDIQELEAIEKQLKDCR